MGTKGKGLLALLGLGALAFWKYKNASPEDQQAVKDKINCAKDNLNKWGNELKSKASEVVDQVKEKTDDVKTSVENSASEN
jgi:hypothetical protein